MIDLTKAFDSVTCCTYIIRERKFTKIEFIWLCVKHGVHLGVKELLHEYSLTINCNMYDEYVKDIPWAICCCIYRIFRHIYMPLFLMIYANKHFYWLLILLSLLGICHGTSGLLLFIFCVCVGFFSFLSPALP